MLKNHDIICLSLPTWEGDYMKTIVQIMGRLARHNRVLFVDYPFTGKDMMMTWLGRQQAPTRRMLGLDDRLRSVYPTPDAHVHVLTLPPVWPVNAFAPGRFRSALLQTNVKVLQRTIRSAMRHLHMQRPLVINAFNPIYGLPLVGAFDEQLRIYYCYDEIAAAPWVQRHGPAAERAYLDEVDLVVTTSEALQDSRSRLHPHCYCIPNGVDFGLFNQAAHIHTPPNTRPCVGYLGSLDGRLDGELLSEVIQGTPDLDFRFVGRIVSDRLADHLRRFPNVTLTGPRPPERLPDELARMDLGIIPFVCDDLTRNIYPLKLNEYLAAGKPVVMTPFADLNPFADLVSVASDPTLFRLSLYGELRMDSPDRQCVRMARARQNDWSGRVEQLSMLIEQHLSTPLRQRP